MASSSQAIQVRRQLPMGVIVTLVIILCLGIAGIIAALVVFGLPRFVYPQTVEGRLELPAEVAREMEQSLLVPSTDIDTERAGRVYSLDIAGGLYTRYAVNCFQQDEFTSSFNCEVVLYADTEGVPVYYRGFWLDAIVVPETRSYRSYSMVSMDPVSNTVTFEKEIQENLGDLRSDWISLSFFLSILIGMVVVVVWVIRLDWNR